MDPRESVPDHCVFSNRSAIGTTRLRSARTAELRTVAVYGLCFSFIHLFCKLPSGQPGVTAVDQIYQNAQRRLRSVSVFGK